MKQLTSKKIVSGLLILSLIVPLGFLSVPQKAGAQFAVIDAENIVQSSITAANTGISSFSSMSLQLKAYVLDTLATTAAKMLIRQITASVVNWINSGFQGNPSFVTNPGSFFLNVADQITGDFLSKYGGPLNQLCSPFSIDIRLALSFKYHPQVQQKYLCTLGAIIQNGAKAIPGASINGFTAGDFKQGGWPAFVSLTTEPQNNPMGAYLIADDELSIRVANSQLTKKAELGQSQGFLSWHNVGCMQQVSQLQQYKKDLASDPAGESPNGAKALQALRDAGGDFSETGPQTQDDCPIETPGSVINSALGQSVNGPLQELGVVDSINQIVSALAATLVTSVLHGGLTSVSGTGPSDSTAYINQIQNEAAINNSQINSIKNNLLQNIGTYLNNTTQYKNNKDQSLNTMIDVKNTYDIASLCYSNALNSVPPPTGQQQSQYEQAISQIGTKVATDVTPLLNQLTTEDNDAKSRLASITSIQQQASSAQTSSDLNAPSQQYSQLLQNQNLTTANDIVNSQQELSETQSTATPLKQDAQQQAQQCQTLTASRTQSQYSTSGFGTSGLSN